MATVKKNSFIMIDNETTHQQMFLQAPNYIPMKNVTNYGTSTHAHDDQYHSNAATLLRWTDFFNYLKEQDLYDNTRIIIVSDHGSGTSTGAYRQTGNLSVSIQAFVSTLFVKDFNSRGEMKTDMTFMTNADTPYLATTNLIEDAKNPFTGNPFQVTDKFERTFIADAEDISTRLRFNNHFKVRRYFKIKDNIFNEDNWYIYNEGADE